MSSDKKTKRKNKDKGSEKTTEETLRKKSSNMGVLLILIILLLAVDVISLSYFFYYNSDRSANTEDLSQLSKCEDGTPYGSCSVEKPYYCVEGELLKKAFTCGCPEGYKVDFQDCKKV